MPTVQKLILAVFTQAAVVSSAYASEQSEAKGFIEDSHGSILFRTAYNSRDKKNGGKDTGSYTQSALLNINSGFTPGIIGFGVGITGNGSFKIGENKHAGSQTIPRHNDGSTYDHWARGGGYVKARFSNTMIRYGTQVLDFPLFASSVGSLGHEFFTGTLLSSNEIKNMEIIAGKFTKNQYTDQIETDGVHLDRAIVWGAKYQFNDNLKASYYGLDIKNKLDRHYTNLNFKQPLANNKSLTYDFSGYHTKFGAGASTYSATGTTLPDYKTTGIAGEEKTNNIWAISTTYSTGPHSVMLAYQQNTGNVGYDYAMNADGYQSIYLPNSYLSDFSGNDEKSAQIQYSVDFGELGIPGLKLITAFAYGWNIRIQNVINDAQEREFFNQLKYTIQSGFAKDASFRIRHTYFRASDSYESLYLKDSNDFRVYIDIPVTLF